MQTLCSKIKVFPHLIKESDLVVLTQLVYGYWIKVKCGAQCLNSQLGCGLSCTVLNLLREAFKKNKEFILGNCPKRWEGVNLKTLFFIVENKEI